jgi:hypothetical protein
MAIIVAFREDRNIRNYGKDNKGDIPSNVNLWFALRKSFTFGPLFVEEQRVNGACYLKTYLIPELLLLNLSVRPSSNKTALPVTTL